jgi:hypothetical protein
LSIRLIFAQDNGKRDRHQAEEGVVSIGKNSATPLGSPDLTTSLQTEIRSFEDWREKVGYYGVMDQDRITEADGFFSRSEAIDYMDHVQPEEVSQ